MNSSRVSPPSRPWDGLTARLSAAFVVTTLIGVALLSALAYRSATDQFQLYVSRQEAINQQALVEDLADFYVTTGAWSGVERLFTLAPLGPGAAMMGGGPLGQGAGRGAGLMRGRASRILADASGAILYSERPERQNGMLSPAELAGALEITDNQRRIGYLLVDTPVAGVLGQAQQAFLSQLGGNLVLAATGASIAAILAGVLIARAIAAPLRNLEEVAGSFSRRDWSRRAGEAGVREFGQVAAAMNNMADSLQAAEKARRDLTADVAHELRTPLTVMQGSLRAMLDGVYEMEKGEIARIYDETRLLSRLVDDLRDIALAEAGQLKLHTDAVDIGQIVRATVDAFRPAAEEHGVSLACEVLPAAPVASADPDRVKQVLRNLVGNALRHTASGGNITVRVSATQQPEPGQIVVEVRDTGSGIGVDDIARVFDRFYRGDRARSRQQGGSGLGLAIAKSLIEAMRGRIGVESAPGEGSRFWFSLPCPVSQSR